MKGLILPTEVFIVAEGLSIYFDSGVNAIAIWNSISF